MPLTAKQGNHLIPADMLGGLFAADGSIGVDRNGLSFFNIAGDVRKDVELLSHVGHSISALTGVQSHLSINPAMNQVYLVVTGVGNIAEVAAFLHPRCCLPHKVADLTAFLIHHGYPVGVHPLTINPMHIAGLVLGDGGFALPDSKVTPAVSFTVGFVYQDMTTTSSLFPTPVYTTGNNHSGGQGAARVTIRDGRLLLEVCVLLSFFSVGVKSVQASLYLATEGLGARHLHYAHRSPGATGILHQYAVLQRQVDYGWRCRYCMHHGMDLPPAQYKVNRLYTPHQLAWIVLCAQYTDFLFRTKGVEAALGFLALLRFPRR